MDPQTDLPDLVEDLEVNIDELTETLAPLLNTQLSTTASSLPLLDKAKLYVLAAYSVESLLYSTLQASGVNAKEHAIFKELARLKGYFGKIKQAEERATAGPPKTKLDVGAAARFIKHGLAGNDKYDLERAERMAKERARAQLKAKQINKKFDDDSEEGAAGKKREIEDVEAVKADEEEGEDAAQTAQPSSKKLKVASEDAMDVDSAPSPALSQASSKKGKKKSKRGSKTSKSADPSDNDETSPTQSQDPSQEGAASSARPKRKQRGRKGKKDVSADQDMAEAGGEEQETSTLARTTRTRAAAAAADALNENEGAVEASAEKPKRGRGRPRKSK